MAVILWFYFIFSRQGSALDNSALIEGLVKQRNALEEFKSFYEGAVKRVCSFSILALQ